MGRRSGRAAASATSSSRPPPGPRARSSTSDARARRRHRRRPRGAARGARRLRRAAPPTRAAAPARRPPALGTPRPDGRGSRAAGRAGGARRRRPRRAAAGAAGGAGAPATCSSSPTRSSPRPRAAWSWLDGRDARRAGARAGGRSTARTRARSRSSSRERRACVRAERGVLICRTRHGFVCANAGVDASNAARAGASSSLLPARPRRLGARAARARLPGAPAVVIADSFGRAWRHGQCDVAIGIAGLAPLEDWRGRPDAAGRSFARRGSRSPTRPPRPPTSRAPARTRASPRWSSAASSAT